MKLSGDLPQRWAVLGARSWLLEKGKGKVPDFPALGEACWDSRPLWGEPPEQVSVHPKPTSSVQVLGREVYTSNNQLGGVQIMHNNGVAHITVPDDFEGVFTILEWLSYLPRVLLSPSIPTPNQTHPSTQSLKDQGFTCWVQKGVGAEFGRMVGDGFFLLSPLLPALAIILT